MLDESDQDRFIQLWTTAQPAVAGYIRAVVRDTATAKDLLQETALVLLKNLHSMIGKGLFSVGPWESPNFKCWDTGGTRQGAF